MSHYLLKRIFMTPFRGIVFSSSMQQIHLLRLSINGQVDLIVKSRHSLLHRDARCLDTGSSSKGENGCNKNMPDNGLGESKSTCLNNDKF